MRNTTITIPKKQQTQTTK